MVKEELRKLGVENWAEIYSSRWILVAKCSYGGGKNSWIVYRYDSEEEDIHLLHHVYKYVEEKIEVLFILDD